MHVCMQYATAPLTYRVLHCSAVRPSAQQLAVIQAEGSPMGAVTAFLSRPYYHVFVPIRSLSWYIDRFIGKLKRRCFCRAAAARCEPGRAGAGTRVPAGGCGHSCISVLAAAADNHKTRTERDHSTV